MSADTWVTQTRSPEETERLGRALALATASGVVALRGELASGKTCFVHGMASCYSASGVHSPTFTLVNEYGDGPKLYHLDLYRLSGPREVEDLGCAELFESGELCAIEWADRAETLLPDCRVDVTFEHAGDDRRRISVSNRGLLPEDWKSRLDAALRTP
ncbi:MAG: tRNA threonylcarbamoyladenosine biosynthesis protein TsaE [Candidatus Hydrogenedentota bacterium]